MCINTLPFFLLVYSMLLVSGHSSKIPEWKVNLREVLKIRKAVLRRLVVQRRLLFSVGWWQSGWSAFWPVVCSTSPGWLRCWAGSLPSFTPSLSLHRQINSWEWLFSMSVLPCPSKKKKKILISDRNLMQTSWKLIHFSSVMNSVSTIEDASHVLLYVYNAIFFIIQMCLILSIAIVVPLAVCSYCYKHKCYM